MVTVLKTCPGFSLMDIDDCLLDEAHPLVADKRAQARANRFDLGLINSPTHGEVALNRKREMDHGSDGTPRLVQSRWTNVLCKQYPAYLLLAERERHLLDSVACEFPEQGRPCRVSNVSQSNITTGSGLPAE